MSLLFTGVSAAVTTPFVNGELDLDSFEKHLTFLKENNLQAFVINGTTAESPTLTDEEKELTLKTAVKVANGEIPVIAGTGSNNTKEAIILSKKAEELGVDGLLLLTPYYNRTTQEGAIAHFTEISDAVDLPIILYDVPARTGMRLEVETIAELAKHKNIVGIKDATGDLAHLIRTIERVNNKEFAFYGGNDDIALPFYASGGNGLISVVANVMPAEQQRLYELTHKNINDAIDLNLKLYPFTDLLSADLNPLPVKAMVSHLGYGNNELRLPLVSLESEKVNRLINVYEQTLESVK